MRQLALTLTLAAVAAGSSFGAASAQTPPDVRDLVGSRAAGGETALNSRGYVSVRSQAGDDRRWTYWWNARRNACLSIAVVGGRFDSIVTTPAADCRAQRPTTLPGPVAGPVNNGRSEDLRFERGQSSATRSGVIRGYETVTYRLNVRAGQTLSASMQSPNRSAYFNITAPRAREAMFNGSVSGPRARVQAPSSGVYTIQVYLMRNAARRGETARYTLTVGATR